VIEKIFSVNSKICGSYGSSFKRRVCGSTEYLWMKSPAAQFPFHRLLVDDWRCLSFQESSARALENDSWKARMSIAYEFEIFSLSSCPADHSIVVSDHGSAVKISNSCLSFPDWALNAWISSGKEYGCHAGNSSLESSAIPGSPATTVSHLHYLFQDLRAGVKRLIQASNERDVEEIVSLLWASTESSAGTLGTLIQGTIPDPWRATVEEIG